MHLIDLLPVGLMLAFAPGVGCSDLLGTKSLARLTHLRPRYFLPSSNLHPLRILNSGRNWPSSRPIMACTSEWEPI
ncbi:MFS transporter SAT21 [Fusarium oxysporum f. sp. albedinis]|nr:MFS transporter SAT21 [Fusarium oxysporum f. sp. albedinis]